MRSPRIATILVLASCAALAACERERAPTANDAQVAAAPAQAVVELQDVVETRPDYIVGISYPKSANGHPALAHALQAYAEAARAELMKAVAGLQGRKPTAPYDLSLQFTGLVDTPQVVAIAADGSSYTGGAHGNPLVARFVWLPERQELLTAQALVDSPRGWQAVSDYTRDKLLEQAMVRAQGEDMTPEEQQAQVRNLSKMIDQGTTADAANFAQFEPVMDAAGRIAALRFVFPPYQVGPYSDGTQTVDVPASVLLPHVAAGYRELFVHP